MMKPTSETARDAKVLQRYCDGTGAVVNALEDADGKLGGYTVAGPVMDGPITYLDERGEVIGTFHVFSDPQTTENAPGTLERLNARFANVRRIGCDSP